MLPAAHRMRRRAEFTLAVRSGRRSGSTHLVTHLLMPGPDELAADTMTSPATDTVPTPDRRPAGPRVGFVVSKAVGGAVARNRVKRRLRSLVAHRLERLPRGSLLVVRANPAAAAAGSAALAADLDRTLDRLLRPTRSPS